VSELEKRVFWFESQKATTIGVTTGASSWQSSKNLLVGNYLDQDISILQVDGVTITDLGKAVAIFG
jgi:hypothetical protein